MCIFVAFFCFFDLLFFFLLLLCYVFAFCFAFCLEKSPQKKSKIKANRKSKKKQQKCKWTSQFFPIFFLFVFPFCFLFSPFILLLCFLDFADLLFGFSVFLIFSRFFSSFKQIRRSYGLVNITICWKYLADWKVLVALFSCRMTCKSFPFIFSNSWFRTHTFQIWPHCHSFQIIVFKSAVPSFQIRPHSFQIIVSKSAVIVSKS